MNLEAIKAAATAAMQIRNEKSDADAAHVVYVTTANPATVLEMVAEIERLREALMGCMAAGSISKSIAQKVLAETEGEK